MVASAKVAGTEAGGNQADHNNSRDKETLVVMHCQQELTIGLRLMAAVDDVVLDRAEKTGIVWGWRSKDRQGAKKSRSRDFIGGCCICGYAVIRRWHKHRRQHPDSVRYAVYDALQEKALAVHCKHFATFQVWFNEREQNLEARRRKQENAPLYTLDDSARPYTYTVCKGRAETERKKQKRRAIKREAQGAKKDTSK